LLLSTAARPGTPTPFGELLLGGKAFYVQRRAHAGSVAYFSISLPNTIALYGLPLYAQGLCTGSPGPRFSNAVDIVPGF
jgi:hypothetical protein